MANENANWFHIKYENFVKTREYEYGEYFENINYAELIKEEVPKDRLKSSLGEFFHSECKDQLPRRHKSKNARKKAEMLIEGRLNYGNYLEMYNGRKGLLKAMREAVSLGYLRNFRIEEPWHPYVFFDDDRIYTYPFQHKFVVLYTGQARHIFFSKLGKWDLLRCDEDVNDLGIKNPELVERISKLSGEAEPNIWEEIKEVKNKMEAEYNSKVSEGAAVNEIAKKYGILAEYRNPDSIIRQGAIFAGNQHVEDRKDSDDYSKDYQEKAVWFGFLDKAKMFPVHDQGTKSGSLHDNLYRNSIVLEVEIPSNWLAIKGYISGVDHGRVENIKDCVNEFGSPIEMAEELNRDDEFVVPEETGRLPVEFIKSVWDREEFPGTPHFMSREKFIGLMEENFPTRMPGGETHVKAEEYHKEELEELKGEFGEFDEVRRLSGKLHNKKEKAVEKISNIEKNAENLDTINTKISKLEKKIEDIKTEKKDINEKLKPLKQKYFDNNDEYVSEEHKEELHEIRREKRDLGHKVAELKDEREKLKRDKKWEIKEIERNSKHFFEAMLGTFSVNNSIEPLCEELDRLSIEYDIKTKSIQEIVSEVESDQNGVLRDMAIRIMENHKAASEKWDNQNFIMVREYLFNLEEVVEKLSNDLYKVNCSLEHVYNYLNNLDIRGETFDELKKAVKRGFDSADLTDSI